MSVQAYIDGELVTFTGQTAIFEAAAATREPEIEERDECNTCGRTEYMCPGH